MPVKIARKSATSILSMLMIVTAVPFMDISCKKKFPCNPPPLSDGVDIDITLDGFLENCYLTVSGTEHIPYSGTLTIQYIDGCTKKPEEFSHVPINSPNTPQKQPITLRASVPKSRDFIVWVRIQGEKCARCASGHYGATDETWQCNETQSASGYVVAKPAWEGFYTKRVTSGSIGNITLNNLQQTKNVASSCGCTVFY